MNAQAITEVRQEVAPTREGNTLATVGGQPKFEIKGEGTNQFDLKAGLFRELAFTGSIVETSENVTVRVPITMTVKLLEGEALAAALKPPPPLPKPETKPEAKPASKPETKPSLAQATPRYRFASRRTKSIHSPHDRIF